MSHDIQDSWGTGSLLPSRASKSCILRGMARKGIKNGSRLGAFLRRCREEAKMTAEQVARSSQDFDKSFRISQSFLSEIENSGKMPSPLKLLTLSRLYGITIGEIYEVLGASPKEIGQMSDLAVSERRLYPKASQRQIHRDVQLLLNSGLQEPLKRLTDEFHGMLEEYRSSMLKVIEDNRPQAGCVVAGGSLMLEAGLSDEEREAFLNANYPDGPAWVCFTEGEGEDFQLSLFLKDPHLQEPVEATIIVPMVRWWAGMKSVIRRLESQI